MNQLTEAEEQVMLKLWKLESATTKEVLEEYKKDKPAYNTVSTIIRILEKKKFVKHKKKGKKFIYMPKISRADYCKNLLQKMAQDYFEGDYREMVSFINSTRSLESIIL